MRGSRNREQQQQTAGTSDTPCASDKVCHLPAAPTCAGPMRPDGADFVWRLRVLATQRRGCEGALRLAAFAARRLTWDCGPPLGAGQIRRGQTKSAPRCRPQRVSRQRHRAAGARARRLIATYGSPAPSAWPEKHRPWPKERAACKTDGPQGLPYLRLAPRPLPSAATTAPAIRSAKPIQTKRIKRLT